MADSIPSFAPVVCAAFAVAHSLTGAAALFAEMDLTLGFLTSYTDEQGQEVWRVRRIAPRYLRTWFLLDASASVPFALLAAFSRRDGGVSSSMRANKILRLAKLLRLLRMFKLKRLAPMLDVYPAVNSPSLRALPIALGLLYYLHLTACLLHTRLGADAACAAAEV